METIAAIASISQLVVYSASSVRYVQRLFSESNSCHSASDSVQKNFNLLLGIVNRLPTQYAEKSDPLLPISRDISGLTIDTLNLLRPQRIFGFDWAPITNQERLKLSFASLEGKRALLHLHICAVSANLLVNIRQDISSQLKSATQSCRDIMPSESEPKRVMNLSIK